MKHTKGQSMPDGTIQYYKDAMGRAMVSTDYDPTSSYAVGDYCIYDNVRYCCNTAIATGGETWNSAHWDVAKVDDDITEINQSLSKLTLSRSASGTTDANSNLNLNLSSNDYVVKSVYLSNRIAIPFTYNNNWYCSVRQTDSSMSPVANAAVNGYVYYEKQ